MSHLSSIAFWTTIPSKNTRINARIQGGGRSIHHLGPFRALGVPVNKTQVSHFYGITGLKSYLENEPETETDTGLLVGLI